MASKGVEDELGAQSNDSRVRALKAESSVEANVPWEYGISFVLPGELLKRTYQLPDQNNVPNAIYSPT